MIHDKTKNLMFLLAAAPMGLGGCVVGSSDDVTTDNVATDDGTTTGDGDATTGDGDGDPTTGDGDGDPTTGDGDGDPTTGDGDGDPTTGDGDGDPTTGDGDATTGDGDGDGDLCAQYAAHYDECMGTSYYDEYLAYCLHEIEYYGIEYGPDCQAAVESMYACLSALDCAEFDASNCPEELAAIDTYCGGAFVAQLKYKNR